MNNVLEPLSTGVQTVKQMWDSLSIKQKRRIGMGLKILISMAVIFYLIHLRIECGKNQPLIYYSNGIYDDYEMLRSADFPSMYATKDYYGTLIKTLSFPWFLNFVADHGISIYTAISLFWVFAALLVWWMLLEAGAKWYWALCGFGLTLFCPTAWDCRTGMRFYRNILLTPACFCFISLISIEFLCAWKKKPLLWKSLSMLAAGVLLALTYPFFYYLKEDGLWMKLVLIAFSILCMCGVIYQFIRSKRKKIIWPFLVFPIISLALPFYTLNKETNRYIETNTQAFNLPYITLRTDGEFARFYQNVYQIASANRSYKYWAPLDALQKAIEVSPTFQSRPEVVEMLLHETPMTDNTDIYGDFLGWNLLIALSKNGYYTSPGDVNDFFAQVNQEVEAAFKDGRLTRDSKLQLTKQAAGRSREEIQAVVHDLPALNEMVINLAGIRTAPVAVSEEEKDIPVLQLWSEKLKTNLEAPKNEQEMAAFNEWQNRGMDQSNKMFAFYRTVTPWLRYLALFSFVVFIPCAFLLRLINLQKKIRFKRQYKKTGLQWSVFWLICLLAGVALAYSIAIIWFCQFLYLEPGTDYSSMMYEVLGFYGSSVFGMMYPILFLCPVLLDFTRFKRPKKSKKAHPQK